MIPTLRRGHCRRLHDDGSSRDVLELAAQLLEEFELRGHLLDATQEDVGRGPVAARALAPGGQQQILAAARQRLVQQPELLLAAFQHAQPVLDGQHVGELHPRLECTVTADRVQHPGIELVAAVLRDAIRNATRIRVARTHVLLDRALCDQLRQLAVEVAGIRAQARTPAVARDQLVAMTSVSIAQQTEQQTGEHSPMASVALRIVRRLEGVKKNRAAPIRPASIAPLVAVRLQALAVDLLTVGTAFPAHRVEQSVATGSLAALWDLRGARGDAIERLHRSVGVEQRYLTLPIDDYTVPRSFTASNDLFVQHATDLAEAAIRDALDRAGLAAGDLNLLALVTSSGLAVPSIDARLANRLDLRRDLKRLPLFGLGCVGGAAGLARCAEYVKAFPGDVALLVCVELCSLTFQADDTSAANLVATGLFGDAAACAVVAGERWGTERDRSRIPIMR